MNVSDGSQNMNNTRQGERAEWGQSGAVNRTSISPFLRDVTLCIEVQVQSKIPLQPVHEL